LGSHGGGLLTKKSVDEGVGDSAYGLAENMKGVLSGAKAREEKKG